MFIFLGTAGLCFCKTSISRTTPNASIQSGLRSHLPQIFIHKIGRPTFSSCLSSFCLRFVCRIRWVEAHLVWVLPRPLLPLRPYPSKKISKFISAFPRTSYSSGSLKAFHYLPFCVCYLLVCVHPWGSSPWTFSPLSPGHQTRSERSYWEEFVEKLLEEAKIAHELLKFLKFSELMVLHTVLIIVLPLLWVIQNWVNA